MDIAYIGLGSNLGTREWYLSAAFDALAAQFSVVGCSPIYESAPIGPIRKQAHFLNAVVCIGCNGTAYDMLQRCQAIETALGRGKGQYQGPREIDLDVLLFGEQVIDGSNLQVPHPRIHERRFVLQPLCDVTPELRDPRSGQRFSQALNNVSDQELTLLEVPLCDQIARRVGAV